MMDIINVESNLIKVTDIISDSLRLMQECSDEIMKPCMSLEMFELIKNRYANIFSEGMECIGYAQAAYDSENCALMEMAINKCKTYINTSLAFEIKIWQIILKSIM